MDNRRAGLVLLTDRLLLRPPQRADFDAWAEFMADKEAAQFLGGAQEKPVAWRALMVMAGAWALEGFGMFSVIERATGRWVGRVGPWFPNGWPGTEVGWGIVRSAWGKGYAVEAARCSMNWAFDELGWTEIVHCIDPQNVASRRVAEKLGSTLLRYGHLPVPFHEPRLEIWGQTLDAWKRAQR